MDQHGRILGVILAGGVSRRFGSDKALASLSGAPLIEHVARRANPQVDGLAVSRNTPVPLDLPLIADREPDQGPLSGIIASLSWAEMQGFDLVAFFPCDGPLFPADLVARLKSALTGFDCAMATSAGERHYTYGLWRVSALPRLAEAFARGERSLRGIVDVLRVVFVEFGEDAFLNINHPDHLGSAEQRLAIDPAKR